MSEEKKYVRKSSVTGGLWDAYKFYKASNPTTKITRKQYVDVCHLFNKKLSDSIIRESTEFRVFFGLGFIRIRSFKQTIKFTEDGRVDSRKNKIDWGKTRALWKTMYPGKSFEEITKIPNKKLVFHLNEHSNGYIMRWYWEHRTCVFKNRSVYAFKPVKGGISKEGYYYGRLGLAQWIKGDERTNEYYL